MSRVVFVTVGTSAAENEDLMERSPDLRERVGNSKVKDLFGGFEDSPEQIASLETLLLAAHRAFWDENDGYRGTRDNFRQTSAEMISTYSAILSNSLAGGYLQRGQDKVVLLLSNTVIGQACGRLNATLFREYLFRGHLEEAADVILETIEDLNPGEMKVQDFQIYPQIREIVRRHLDGNTKRSLFNITGSYKGLIPPITHLANSSSYGARSSIFYMHETMTTTVTFSFEKVADKPDDEAGALEMTESRRTRAYVNIC